MKTNQFKLVMGWLAGCEPEVLDACTKAEKDKKMTFGIAMLAAVIFSGFAAAFTGYTIFGSVPACLVFALFWAGFVLAIDRAILVFMDRQTKNNGKTWAIISVRLIIVFVLGYLNSTMMELKVFEKEIESQIRQNIDEKTLALKDSLKMEHALLDSSLLAHQERLKKAEDEHSTFMASVGSGIAKLDAQILALRNELIGEIQGRVGSGHQGDGPAAEELRIQIAALESQKMSMLQSAGQADEASVSAIALTEARKVYEKATKESDEKHAQLNEAEKKGEQRILENHTYGFADRYSALHQVASGQWFLAAMFFLLFFAFESMAIILKLLSGKSEYEKAIEIIYANREDEQSIAMQATLEKLAKQYEKDSHFYAEIARQGANVQHAMSTATIQESEILRAKAARLNQLAGDERAVATNTEAFVKAKVEGVEKSLEHIQRLASKPTSNGVVHKWLNDSVQKVVRGVEKFLN